MVNGAGNEILIVSISIAMKRIEFRFEDGGAFLRNDVRKGGCFTITEFSFP